MAFKPILLDETGKEIKTALDNIAAAVASTNMDTWSWEHYKAVVRSGMGAKVVPVGTILPKFTHSVYGDIYMRVERYYTDTNGVNRVKLWSQYWVCDLQFDAAEAFYYAASALPAGTYHFTLASAYNSWAAGTYQFTLTQQLPAKGQLGISGNAGTALTSLKVNAYASRTATSATEQCTITSGSGGTDLGTWGSGNLNHVQRVSYGSNNWGESAMRQFLNSAAAAGSAWTPRTNFDRPPSWASNTAGFMAGLPADVLAVISPTQVFNVTNSVYECSAANGGMRLSLTSNYVTEDYVYLPSRKEIYGSAEHAQDTGDTQFPLYVGTPDSDKIKYKQAGTQVSYYWLRTPYAGSANVVRRENTPGGGALDGYYAHNTSSVLPAFDI